MKAVLMDLAIPNKCNIKKEQNKLDNYKGRWEAKAADLLK